jgi:hypothetical protein
MTSLMWLSLKLLSTDGKNIHKTQFSSKRVQLLQPRRASLKLKRAQESMKKTKKLAPRKSAF